jgi:hypothetical protein
MDIIIEKNSRVVSGPKYKQFEGCEHRTTLSLVVWHKIEDVTQLLDHPSTDERRAAIGYRKATIGRLKTIRTQAGHAHSCSDAGFPL